MKTLIINGSPRRNGDTDALVNELVRHLNGDIMTINCEIGIAPCNDCRYCREQSGCSIADEMQKVYSYLADCDNIVLASPIWFSSLSGPLLNIASRLQTFFCAKHFRKEQPAIKEKQGVLMLVGAEPGTEVIPAKNALTIMKLMNVRRDEIIKVYSMDTDRISASDDERAMQSAADAALALNRRMRI